MGARCAVSHSAGIGSVGLRGPSLRFTFLYDKARAVDLLLILASTGKCTASSVLSGWWLCRRHGDCGSSFLET